MTLHMRLIEFVERYGPACFGHKDYVEPDLPYDGWACGADPPKCGRCNRFIFEGPVVESFPDNPQHPLE